MWSVQAPHPGAPLQALVYFYTLSDNSGSLPVSCFFSSLQVEVRCGVDDAFFFWFFFVCLF